MNMKLEELLDNDKEAAKLFEHLPLEAQKFIRRTGQDIGSLGELRERAIHMINEDGPFYANAVIDGTELDDELKARWVMEHQA